MLCCLNPNCQNPLNLDNAEYCFSCGTKLVSSLGDRYRPVYPLIGGGLGQIFLAQDKNTRQESYLVQQLALPASSKYHQILECFYAKADKLAQLGQHPQIHSVCAYFTQGNYFYLVQPSISGQTLRQELTQKGVFSEQQIWDILSQILPLLYFIHKQQIFHGNIHLENIIRRTSDGRLILINFDLTKQLLDLENSSKKGFETETNLEFSNLGVACLHLLSGIHPYSKCTEDDRAWMANWQQHPRMQAISQELAQVIDKLLQKSPQQKYLVAARSPQPNWLSTLAAEETTALVPRQVDTAIVPCIPTPTAVSTLAVLTKPSKRSWLLGSCFLLLLALVAYLYYWQQRQVVTLTKHTDEVNTVAFTPDGKEFATGSDDRTIKIWDANSLQEIHTLKRHLDWVYSVRISNDSQTLVSGSKDNTIKIWNLNARREIRTLRGHKSYVNYVAISPDGQKIASASYDKTAKIWDLNTGENLTLTGHTAEVLTVAISPDGQKLVTGSGDKTMKIWALDNYNYSVKELRTLRGHKNAVWSVAISPDSQQLYSVSDDKTIKVWNFNTGREIRTLAGHTADINFVAVSPDGQKIATCSDDKTIKLWNIISGAELATFKGHTAAVWAVSFSPDGRRLVSTSEDSTVKIWRVP